MELRTFLAVLAMASALAACGADRADSNGGCTATTCTASCLASGFSAGSCAGGTCTCRGSDGGTDAEADADARPDTSPPSVESFIWISNTGEGTLSKVNTVAAVEVARYITGPYGTANDPSRTSVNRHGDMVVTNRNPNLMAKPSVTKFAASEDDCIDRNASGVIDTSTGPGDVKPWLEDECMLWNTEFGPPSGGRPTAWDGQEDPDTGLGGHVWVATCSWGLGANKVYRLDGDTGEILAEGPAPGGCPYGGAVDRNSDFWYVNNHTGPRIVKVDKGTMATVEYPIGGIGLCHYGIAIDSDGRIWTGGSLCVRRFDPGDMSEVITQVGGDCPRCTLLRGIAVGREMSRGFVWAADSSGDILKIDQATGAFVTAIPVGVPDTIGVAIDFEGYVWAVSQGGNAAYKIDPRTETFTTVPIGTGPYTYSDMTGVQLENVILI
jgi:DNA-binding beta-propeller fold protein YncE